EAFGNARTDTAKKYGTISLVVAGRTVRCGDTSAAGNPFVSTWREASDIVTSSPPSGLRSRLLTRIWYPTTVSTSSTAAVAQVPTFGERGRQGFPGDGLRASARKPGTSRRAPVASTHGRYASA